MNMQAMMQQAQKLQRDMLKAKKEVEDKLDEHGNSAFSRFVIALDYIKTAVKLKGFVRDGTESRDM